MWWTGRPGMLRFMGSQRVGHNWATELNWTQWHMMLNTTSYAICYVLFDEMSVHVFCPVLIGSSVFLLFCLMCPLTQMVKNLPAMQETWVWSLGWEDPLEKGLSIHSRILVWRISWTEEPGRGACYLQSLASHRGGHVSDFHFRVCLFWIIFAYQIFFCKYFLPTYGLVSNSPDIVFHGAGF